MNGKLCGFAVKTMNIDELLNEAVMAGGADLHIQEGRPPFIRLPDTDLIPLTDKAVVKETSVEWLHKRGYKFSGNECLSFSFPMNEHLRCRAHWSRDQAGIRGVLRILYPLDSLPEDEDMPFLAKLTDTPSGLILAVGPTGSGKTTTLWRMLSHINEFGARHIITLEDPIEYVVSGRRSLVTQREKGQHFNDFSQGVRDALRQDPDIILVGEMRDKNTMEAALTAAETGHLVFSTLHTRTAAQTVTRLISMGEGQEASLRYRLSSVLCAVLAQRRINTKKGVRICREILVATPAVVQLIRSGKEHQLETIMQTGGTDGMRTMAQAEGRLQK